MTGLILLALALSGYLSWHYLTGWQLIGCGVESACDRVLSGRWSAVGGVVPISGLAAGVYLAMLAASLFIGPDTEPPVRRLAWRAMLVLVGAAAGSAVWFTVVQKWVIGSFCPYCLATHITGLLLAALVFWRAPTLPEDGSQRTKAGSRTTAPPSVLRRLPSVSVGVALAGLLATCQAVITPPAVYRAGESPSTLPVLDPHTVPLVGSPDAPYVVTVLFDYECPHCQELHWMLDAAVRRYDGKLAFALCPVPLNSRCNPYVPRDVDEFKDSCELAKIALAVWVAKREAFPAFDRWMFSYESGDRWRARSLDAARAKAVELVGRAKFEAAQTDPRIAQHLQTFVRIYGETVQSALNPQRANAIPKLVFGPRWVIPEPNDTEELLSILQDSLAVPKP